MNNGKRMTAVGLTASVLATMVGCPGALAEAAEPANTQSTDENYNILFVTVDQEHYFFAVPDWDQSQGASALGETGHQL